MRLHVLPLALTLLVPLLPAARGQEAPDVDYLVLVPRAGLEAVEPLAAHRAAEGLRVRVKVVEDAVADGARPAERRAALRGLVLRARPRFLLIAADVDQVPAFDVAETATDRPYGDLDGDGLPEVSIGRLPASDPATLGRMVARTIAYERDLAPGAWQKQCALVAGEGRFGPVIDALLENLFQRVVARQIPARFDVDLTYANPRSSFCYPFARFADRVVERMNEGALVMAYVGHGNVKSLDDLTAPDAGTGEEVDYPVLDVSHAPRIDSAAPPVMVVLACWTGRYEGPERCIGEELLSTGRGPVAFFGSSRISHPVPNALLGISLIGALFEDAPGGALDDRLGPRLDRARRALVVPEGDDPLRAEVTLLSSAFVAPDELRRELPRHVDMYNLLGDPALRLARPVPMALEARVDGARVVVKGRAPAGARGATVTLEVPRDRSARPAPAQETLLERYARSNDKVLATALVPVGADGWFEATLAVPAGASPGPHLVKAFAAGERASAAGAAPCTLAGAPAPAATRAAASPGKTYH